MAWEDGGIHDEQVVGAVHLGVGVDDGGAAAAAVVGAHLDGACSLASASSRKVNWKMTKLFIRKKFKKPLLTWRN